MISVCLYFQIHQPFRIRKDYSFFQIGEDHFYEDEEANRGILNKVSDKCYLPANQIIYDLIREHEGKFKVAFCVSGVTLEQFAKYRPEVIESFQRLAATGACEFINETYYHSLSFLYSKEEFKEQVLLHKKLIQKLFNQTPVTFRNTELIYSNELARFIDAMNYKVILSEGADQILGWRSPNYLYQPFDSYKLNLLLKNYKLSDDIAFRFSNRSWEQYPLTAEKYAGWIESVRGNGELINLFMDYETFGEHQWADTGIFDFLKALPKNILRNPEFRFLNPRDIPSFHAPLSKIDVPYYISWADLERDLTAWIGNSMQNAALDMIYKLEKPIKASKDPALIDIWRKLQTSDHFYYMCTKWFSDGDVHKYFNPFPSPYDAFIAYCNILNDLRETLKQRKIEV